MKRRILLSLTACFLFAFSWAQTKVTGRVISDSTKQGLQGVSVTVKGTSTATSTDGSGRYSITIPAASTTLIFSFVGFRTLEVPVNGRTTIDVEMSEEATALNDIVVIGYGTARRKDLTGTVSSISGAQLEKIPVANAAEALTGRLPGVQVTTLDGSPGAEVVIRVRGGGSITGSNSPLYIVDGFRMNSINDIAPSDIASIDVLKDAATTAIYGAAGANGVVIVTTKNPKAGKTVVSYNGFAQARTLPRKLEVLSPYEFVLAQYEYARIRSQTDVDNFTKYFGVYDDLELYKNQKGTDWQDELFGDPLMSWQHSFSIQGGTDKTKISLNLSNNTDNGLIQSSGYMRNYLNFKLNHEISPKVKFDFSSRFTHTVIDGAGTSGSSSLRISDAITTRPVNGIADQIVFDPGVNSDDYEQFLKGLVNPVTLAEQDYRKRTSKAFNLMVAGSWNAMRNLTLRSEFGLDLGFGTVKRYYGPLTTTSKNEGGNLPMGEITHGDYHGYRWTNTANYSLKKGSKHDLSFMLGQEILVMGKGFEEYTRAKNFTEGTSPEKLFATMALGVTDRHTTFDFPGDKLASFFGRAIYQFNNKYIFNFTARYDGSTKFAPGNQWGFFPAASAAWRISQEDFMQDVDFISDLKLRASIGQVGNNNIRDDQWRVQFSPTDNRPIGFGDIAQPYYVAGGQLPNPEIRWETTTTRNIGLDFTLFRNRISGTLDFYKNTVDDLLVESQIPQTTGYPTQQTNIGRTSNKGVELGLTANLVSKKDFQLSFNFNVGINRAKIDELDGVNERQLNSDWAGTDLKTRDDYRLIVGEAIGLMYGYVTDGMYTVDDFESYDPVTRVYKLKQGVANVGAFMGGISVRPGVLKLKDLDGDSIITGADRMVIGNAQPKHTGGFGFTGSFKGLDFQALFNWVYGNDVYNTGRISFNMLYRTTYGNMLNTMKYEDRFHYIDAQGNQVTGLTELAKLNPNAKMWSPFSMGNASPVIHSWAIEDGSFLRLGTLSVGYSLPKRWISQLYMTRFRVYATVYNAFVWTNYSGYDPEVTTTRSSSYSQLTPGVDFSAYPKSRSFTAGINVTF